MNKMTEVTKPLSMKKITELVNVLNMQEEDKR